METKKGERNMEWDVKEMAVSNAPKRQVYGRGKVWLMEDTMSREEKIQAIDDYTGGQMSRLLSVINTFEKEKDTLKKSSCGIIKAVSLNAWLRRHPCDSISDGEIHILGLNRSFQGYDHMRSGFEFYHDLTDEVFHHLLCKMERDEREYYRKNDKRCILCRKVENHPLFGFFGNRLHLIISSRDGILAENEEPLSVPQLKYLADEMDKLQTKMNKDIVESCDGFAAVSEKRRG